MKKFLILSAMGALLAASSQAAITTYIDEGDFLAALGAATTTFDDFTGNTSLFTTFTTGGTSPNGAFRGLTNDERLDQVSSNGATLTIGPSSGQPLFGFGGTFDLSPGGAGQSMVIRINLTGGGTEDVGVTLGSGYGGFSTPFFFGFTSTNPFDSVTLLNGPGGGIAESFAIDDITLAEVTEDEGGGGDGGEIPEPSTFGLLGLAMLGLGAFRRVRR